MKQFLVLAAFLIPVYMFSQGFGSFSHDQPFLAKDTTASSEINPQALAANYWWRYHDMPTNISVTNWSDTIRGSVWTNASASIPTNSSIGVRFDKANSQQLTNSGIDFTDLSMTWLILQRTSDGSFQYILSKDNGGALNLAFFADNRIFLEQVSVSKFDGTIAVNTWFDLAFVSDSVNGVSYFYTNGVPAVTNSPNISVTSFWRFLGGIAAGGFWNGNLREMAVWTNTIVTSSNIFELHKYATNKYAY